jgi:uridine kinase
VSPLATVLGLVAERPATLGSGRLVCVDGPAGSGKSTFAELLAHGPDGPRGHVVHVDDLLEGWSGLATVDVQLDTLLRPLASGEAGHYRRYDWLSAAWAETVAVEPVPLLVVEGVGSGAARFDDLRTVLVWLEAPYDVRLRRGLDRDGAAFAPHWEQWARDERELFGREHTRERADVVVDGTAPFA